MTINTEIKTLSELKDVQSLLDNHIWTKKGLSREETQNKRLTALLVEFFEFVNATEDFKYWKSTEPSRDKIVEEYIDILHFALSLSVDFDHEIHHLADKGIAETSMELTLEILIDRIPSLVKKVKKVKTKEEKEIYFLLLIGHVQMIGAKLDLTEEQVIQKYLEKNKINYDRQKQGY